LLLDDFADVTPQLLRTAYVEALYRADDFEFERLTQSFWYSFIMDVARQQSVEAVQQKFPTAAEDSSFCRPAMPFAATHGGARTSTSASASAKRTPVVSC
jgi:hypothetical protein